MCTQDGPLKVGFAWDTSHKNTPGHPKKQHTSTASKETHRRSKHTPLLTYGRLVVGASDQPLKTKTNQPLKTNEAAMHYQQSSNASSLELCIHYISTHFEMPFEIVLEEKFALVGPFTLGLSITVGISSSSSPSVGWTRPLSAIECAPGATGGSPHTHALQYEYVLGERRQ